MPTIMNEFFSKLGTDEELPIIPMLAIGHVMKGLSVSMMSYYKCFFDPMLKSMGVKEGSPEYNQYYKGKVIRKTNDLVTNATETLAIVAAGQYYQNKSGLADPTSESVVVIDRHMRPQSITITRSLKAVARDFQLWMKEEWGTDKRAEVGPSGFERKTGQAYPQQLDPLQHAISQSIEADVENYQRFFNMKYGDDGLTLGLLSRCTNAGVVDPSSRRDKETLAKKQFDWASNI